MKDVTVSGIQMFCELGQKEENLKKIEKWSKLACQQHNADLVCFPETSITGFYCAGVDPKLSGDQVYESVRKLAEHVPGGPAVKYVEDLAKRLGVYISAGLFELDNHIVYNCYFICGPDGFIGKYRKTHMPAGEYPYCRFGGEYPIFDVAGSKIGISTCFDNTMPEVPRILALKGAEIILMPHAWSNEDVYGPITSGKVEDRRNEVLTFIPSRAYDNKAYVVYLDQVGRVSESYSYPGYSALINPKGQVLAESLGKEELLFAEFKSELMEDERGRPDSSMRARRPETYRALTYSSGFSLTP
jgi:predicted amidohydrolase